MHLRKAALVFRHARSEVCLMRARLVCGLAFEGVRGRALVERIDYRPQLREWRAVLRGRPLHRPRLVRSRGARGMPLC